MLENHDFIDPRLVSKLKTFELQINRLLKQQNIIKANSNTSKESKMKLLNYNNQCIQTNRRLLEELKSQMVDYYDKQIQELNKRPLHSNQLNPKSDYEAKQNFSSNINDVSLSFANKQRFMKTQRFSIQTYKNQDSTLSGDKINGKLNSTSYIQFQNGSKNILSNSKDQLCVQQQQKKTRKVKRKATKNRYRLYVRKCKIYQRQINAFRIGFDILMEEKYALQLKSQEDQEIVNLQNEKIRILQYKCKHLLQQRQNIDKFYKRQVSQVLSNHTQLKRIQEENKALLMQRNLLLNKLKSK